MSGGVDVALLLGEPLCAAFRLVDDDKLFVDFRSAGADVGVDEYYPFSWIGAFGSSWRILRDDSLLAGSSDALTEEELADVVPGGEGGRFVSIEMLGDGFVGVNFSNGIRLEYLLTDSREEWLLVVSVCGHGTYVLSPSGEFSRDVDSEGRLC